ncbi:MAG: osmoprotectant NAGGN system M42 family peptidase [Gammaproteobacteria bacterium]|nr:osmoprotectant NAGGN system M42 family peptidase [Gammaproteobacteria bacterium]
MIDRENMQATLLDLLAIPSPCGLTDEIIRYIAGALRELEVEFQITRRGTIRARLAGSGDEDDHIARAVVNHVDSIGAMVRMIKPDGRLSLVPIGYWSSRFAEGARVTIFSDQGTFRGTLLPILNWNVSRDRGVEDVAISWDTIELRVDEPVFSADDVRRCGISVGDYIALDPVAEALPNGYIVGRNIDNKAGAAAVLAAIRQIKQQNLTLPRDIYVLFTVTETIGSGSGSAILPDISELVTVDFASIPPSEKSPFKRVTIASGDAAGPYDFHLTGHLQKLAQEKGIPYQRKVLEASHNDAASALAAGHDVRTAVITYAGDASHSLERTHIESLENVARLLIAYMTSQPAFEHDPSVTTVDKFTQQIDTSVMPRPATLTPDPAALIRRNRD